MHCINYGEFICMYFICDCVWRLTNVSHSWNFADYCYCEKATSFMLPDLIENGDDLSVNRVLQAF